MNSGQMSMFSAADFHASPTVTPGGAEARTMTVTSGRKCEGLSELSVRGGCLARMSRVLFRWKWASTECFLTWRDSVTPSGRLLFRLVPSTPRTVASGAGSLVTWPTVRGQDGSSGPDYARSGRAESGGDDLVTVVAKMWQSPMPSDVDGGRTTKGKARQSETGIRGEAEVALMQAKGMTPYWETPIANEERAEKHTASTSKRHFVEGTHQVHLAQTARMWPTAMSQEAKHGAATEWEMGTSHAGTKDSLRVHAARLWLTPTRRDHKDGTNVAGVDENALLGRQVKPSKGGGALNPEFVCWLMGFPEGWLNLER